MLEMPWCFGPQKIQWERIEKCSDTQNTKHIVLFGLQGSLTLWWLQRGFPKFVLDDE